MQSSSLRAFGWVPLVAVCACFAVAPLSGCGGSPGASGSGSSNGSGTELEAAKASLATPTKAKGKTLPADTNLSVRERRLLSKEGQLPK